MAEIRCMLMRGGTSKGPFFDQRDLPSDPDRRDAILLRVMGSPDPRQIDGLGGTDATTSKIVMVKPSDRDGIDVDYLFAQVAIDRPIVDTSPPCGNMMAGVAPFAIERGMVKTDSGETTVMIYNVNTDSVIEAVVQTPDGRVTYEGDTAISGVPGTAAPVLMNLFDQTGRKTGRLFPTGKLREEINGIDVTLIDAATPMMHLKAEDLGLTCCEPKVFYIENEHLMRRLEEMRREAGERMGMGDVADSVLPKVALVAPASDGGNIKSQYFTPRSLHAAYAVTGSISISTASLIAGTVASDVASVRGLATETITIEHPSGTIDAVITSSGSGLDFLVKMAGTIRTARKLMDGVVSVPDQLL